MLSVAAMAKEIAPTDRLIDSFTPSEVPVGPDGTPSPMPAQAESKLAPIPMCALGPCIHYHEVITKFDAQEPLDGTRGSIHVQTTRTCYPSPGIEMDVTEHPVYRCNLWEPRSGLVQLRLRNLRKEYEGSDRAHAEFRDYLESWPIKTEGED